RKYYGKSMAAYLFIVLYIAAVLSGYLVEQIFSILNLVPLERNADILHASITWNYTTYLNIIFLTLTAGLIWQFLRTGGPKMLRDMNSTEQNHSQQHGHHCH